MLLAPAPFIASTAVQVSVCSVGGKEAVHLCEVKLSGSFSRLSGVFASCNWAVSYLSLLN